MSGRYDALSEEILRRVDAAAVLLIVLDNNPKASGFSLSARIDPLAFDVPKLLRDVAADIELQAKRKVH